MSASSQTAKQLNYQMNKRSLLFSLLAVGLAVSSIELAGSKGIIPGISFVTAARADDDDGGGFRRRGFRGGGFRMRGIGLPIGIPGIRLGAIPRIPMSQKRYRKPQQPKPVVSKRTTTPPPPQTASPTRAARSVVPAPAPRRSRGELVVAGLTPSDVAALEGEGFKRSSHAHVGDAGSKRQPHRPA